MITISDRMEGGEVVQNAVGQWPKAFVPDCHGRAVKTFAVCIPPYLLKIVPGLTSRRLLGKNAENPLYSQLGRLEGIEK